MRRRGIQVRLGTKLVSAEGGHIILDDGTELAAGALVWTVGGTANPLASASDLPVDEAGRVRVTERLSVTGIRQDAQRWMVWLLGRYSDPYVAS